MNRLQDEELVVLCLQGNRDAFAELVKRYERQIYSLAYRLTNNYHDAIDLSQEVFLHLYRVLDKFDGERKFFPWMYRIATNVCYNALKKKPKESTTLDQVMEFISDDKSQPEITFEKKRFRKRCRKPLQNCPKTFGYPWC
nr:sigma-70 family RNA polymerase sigma factor [Dehalobacterium formicoaceticum]